MSNHPNHMRTELRRVRYLGSARSGTTGSMHMRLTSLALVPLTVGFVWLALSLVGKPYRAALATLSQPVASIFLLLFILAGIYHMQLGIRNIVDDYVHDEHVKEWSLAANLFACFVVGIASVYAVMRLSFL
ncbi:succinate dehydrogenase, hydrophobic membrane anchor protein [Lichenibacterium ramalinae]|uniref:Succinate dehydrogenase hydrophobic membrane anchor subunit n=1 Tax=Lichenibacterium ramalinae TaxID=2316527 RepID=A0A4V1RIC1_9HYPH|nr:succinate dehydrogenase, hydrophobic membrane anchor protein [Lichenibacterium ramalinae]RYB03227.1 succinate dehydrogenase, hydrophobic membrane anchor protein [Lichenibacterium ramalinae]